MAVLDVVKYPDPRLREPTFDVEAFDDGLRQLVRDLADTMFAMNGAGIAAIQVGRLERVFLIDGRVAGREDDEPVVLVNPEIIEEGRGKACGPGARCLLIQILSPDRSGLIRVMGVDLVKQTIAYRTFLPSEHPGIK